MDLSKFERHIDKPFKFKIGEDEFEMPLIGMEHISDLLTAYKLLDGVKTKEDFKKIDENMTPEVLDALNRLIMVSLKKSYPEASDEMLEDFAVSNFPVLIVALLNANRIFTDKTQSSAVHDRLAELRAKDVQTKASGAEEAKAESV